MYGMGIPILHGVKGESAKIISECEVGLCFEPENSEDLVHKIIELMQKPDLTKSFRRNGAMAAKTVDRRNLAHEMLLILNLIFKTNK